MKKRLLSLARIVELKNHQRRADELRLAALQRREAEFMIEQELLIQALNADQPLHGLFVETMARRLRALSEQLETNRQAQATAAALIKRHATQLKVAERLFTDATRASERAVEAKELAEMIDATLARDATSLP